MDQLLVLLGGIVVWLSPLLLVGGLLAVAGRRDRRELARIARQTRISDAVAAEVGAIVAPVVAKRHGTWRVSVAVPLGRPALVARIVGVLHRTLGRLGPDGYEIVLSPQEPMRSVTACRRAERPAKVA